MVRNDYINRRSQILTQSSQRPYTTTVRQRGTFYNSKQTYGTDRNFPLVTILVQALSFSCRKRRRPSSSPLTGPSRLETCQRKDITKLSWAFPSTKRKLNKIPSGTDQGTPGPTSFGRIPLTSSLLLTSASTITSKTKIPNSATSSTDEISKKNAT